MELCQVPAPLLWFLSRSTSCYFLRCLTGETLPARRKGHGWEVGTKSGCKGRREALYVQAVWMIAEGARLFFHLWVGHTLGPMIYLKCHRSNCNVNLVRATPLLLLQIALKSSDACVKSLPFCETLLLALLVVQRKSTRGNKRMRCKFEALYLWVKDRDPASRTLEAMRKDSCLPPSLESLVEEVLTEIKEDAVAGNEPKRRRKR